MEESRKLFLIHPSFQTFNVVSINYDFNCVFYDCHRSFWMLPPGFSASIAVCHCLLLQIITNFLHCTAIFTIFYFLFYFNVLNSVFNPFHFFLNAFFGFVLCCFHFELPCCWNVLDGLWIWAIQLKFDWLIDWLIILLTNVTSSRDDEQSSPQSF